MIVEEAFWIFVSLVENFGIKNYYLKQEKLFELTEGLEIMFQKQTPVLFKHLTINEPSNIWLIYHGLFLVLSLQELSYEFCPRILDLIFTFNIWVLIKLFFVITKSKKEEIFQIKREEQLKQEVKNIIRRKSFLDIGGINKFFKEMAPFLSEREIWY